jgi:hypothetical protein
MRKNSAPKPDLKLKLNRETLRVLALPRLEEVVGGTATIKYSNCGSCNTGLETELEC